MRHQGVFEGVSLALALDGMNLVFTAIPDMYRHTKNRPERGSGRSWLYAVYSEWLPSNETPLGRQCSTSAPR